MPSTMNISPVVTPGDMMERRSRFVDWVEDSPTTQFINEQGTVLDLVAPRRGNQSYVKRQRRRYRRFLDRLGEQRYSAFRIPGRKKFAVTQDLLFTFTYPHDKYGIDECNARVSGDLKKMRTYINRIFKSQFGTITCYESTESGYPAPHLIVRFDKIYSVFQYYSKKRRKFVWGLRDNQMRLDFQAAWRNIGGGFCDIQGIVNEGYDCISHAISYAFKYLTKTMVGDRSQKSKLTAINTLANNKAFNRGTVYISPAFVQRTPNPALNRLDIIRTKLQQAINKFYTLKRKLNAKPHLHQTLRAQIDRLQHVIDVLRSNLPPPEWRYLATIPAVIVRMLRRGSVVAF